MLDKKLIKQFLTQALEIAKYFDLNQDSIEYKVEYIRYNEIEIKLRSQTQTVEISFFNILIEETNMESTYFDDYKYYHHCNSSTSASTSSTKSFFTITNTNSNFIPYLYQNFFNYNTISSCSNIDSLLEIEVTRIFGPEYISSREFYNLKTAIKRNIIIMLLFQDDNYFPNSFFVPPFTKVVFELNSQKTRLLRNIRCRCTLSYRIKVTHNNRTWLFNTPYSLLRSFSGKGYAKEQSTKHFKKLAENNQTKLNSFSFLRPIKVDLIFRCQLQKNSISHLAINASSIY